MKPEDFPIGSTVILNENGKEILRRFYLGEKLSGIVKGYEFVYVTVEIQNFKNENNRDNVFHLLPSEIELVKPRKIRPIEWV